MYKIGSSGLLYRIVARVEHESPFWTPESCSVYSEPPSFDLASCSSRAVRLAAPDVTRAKATHRRTDRMVRMGGRPRRGRPVAPAGRCEGIQEILANEATDEAGSADQNQPPGKRERPWFWHSAAQLRRGLAQFWHSRGDGKAKSMEGQMNNSFVFKE